MKNIRNQLIVLFSINLILPHLGLSQDDPSFELSYEVNRVYPSISITKERLDEARTLVDINQYYKPSWVKEYLSVEVSANHEEKRQVVMSKNDTLTQVQKDLINTADNGTDISVKVHYIPNNDLKQNDPKEIQFTFTVDPQKEAVYSGGEQQLRQYLEENIGNKIVGKVFDLYRLTAVKFTIDEGGQIIDAQIFDSPAQTFRHKQIEELLLEAVCNMPNWKPAEYADGMKVKQEFVLTLGDHRSCVVNLLNIRRN